MPKSSKRNVRACGRLPPAAGLLTGARAPRAAESAERAELAHLVVLLSLLGVARASDTPRRSP